MGARKQEGHQLGGLSLWKETEKSYIRKPEGALPWIGPDG